MQHSGAGAPSVSAHARTLSNLPAYDCAPRQIQRIVLTSTEHHIIFRPSKRPLRIESRSCRSLGHQVSDEACCDSRAEYHPSDSVSAPNQPRADRLPILYPSKLCSGPRHWPRAASLSYVCATDTARPSASPGVGSTGWRRATRVAGLGIQEFFRGSTGQAIGPPPVPERGSQRRLSTTQQRPGESQDPPEPANPCPHRR